MSENPSGIVPVQFHVLVKQDTIDDKTEGGLIIPLSVVEQAKYQQELGTLVAVGSEAFADFSEVDRERLVPGARIMTNKYSGTTVQGKDRVKYQLCNDKDVTALIEEGVSNE